MLSSQKIFEAEIITITSKIGIDKNQLSVNSRENSKTFSKIQGTALVTLNKVGGNPVSYNIFIYTAFFSFLYYMCSYENCVTFSFFYFSFLYNRHSLSFPFYPYKKQRKHYCFIRSFSHFIPEYSSCLHDGYNFFCIHLIFTSSLLGWSKYYFKTNIS